MKNADIRSNNITIFYLLEALLCKEITDKVTRYHPGVISRKWPCISFSHFANRKPLTIVLSFPQHIANTDVTIVDNNNNSLDNFSVNEMTYKFLFA